MLLEHIVREILRHSAQEGGKGQVVNLGLLESVWPWLVGQDMARRTRPLTWRAGTLHVAVSSYAWVQELSFHREELMARIRRLFPWPLRELRLTVSERFEPLSLHEELPLIASPGLARSPRQPWREELLDEAEVAQDLAQLDDETRQQLLRIRALACKG